MLNNKQSIWIDRLIDMNKKRRRFYASRVGNVVIKLSDINIYD
jgi:hypothetical protein